MTLIETSQLCSWAAATNWRRWTDVSGYEAIMPPAEQRISFVQTASDAYYLYFENITKAACQSKRSPAYPRQFSGI
ncbi:hypothetical protein [Burkholderia sp. JP2-270]|uniref:hypothetical protein n=1 Tax=Burkholderia sp. JP2-270 TaxID=2217913 RepID=UPI0013A6F7A3|nr:hypothetical protein [Burkholderia sp. JP2-270]